MVPGLKPILNEENFDVIHLHEPLMPMLCAGVLYHSHTINVGTFHAFDGTPGYNFLRPISDFVLGRLIQKLDRRIDDSVPHVAHAIQELGLDRKLLTRSYVCHSSLLR